MGNGEGEVVLVAKVFGVVVELEKMWVNVGEGVVDEDVGRGEEEEEEAEEGLC